MTSDVDGETTAVTVDTVVTVDSSFDYSVSVCDATLIVGSTTSDGNSCLDMPVPVSDSVDGACMAAELASVLKVVSTVDVSDVWAPVAILNWDESEVSIGSLI